MKKLLCALLALTLILSLAACGNQPAQPPAPQPDASQSVEPETQAQPDQSGQPVQPDEPDQPSDPGNPARAEGPFTEAERVVFSGLADTHSVEVILSSGEYLVLQFDPEQYGELFQTMQEGDAFWITYEDTRPEEEGVFYGITHYFGPDYQGLMLAEGGNAGAVDLGRCAWYLMDNEGANASCLLYLTEELKDLAFYRVEYQEDGSFKMRETLGTLDELPAGCAIGLELNLPELIPSTMLEFSRTDGTRVQYLIASDLSGFYLPVCLVNVE